MTPFQICLLSITPLVACLLGFFDILGVRAVIFSQLTYVAGIWIACNITRG
jgi:hypothetical protein